MSAAALVVLASANAAGEGERIPGALFGGGLAPREPTPVRIDPALPRGHRIVSHQRPSAHLRVCSWRRPVCVHARNVDTDLTPSLAALEQAFERLVVVLDLPAPLADGELGGSPALDVYLTPTSQGVRVSLDVAISSEDSAASFCEVGSQELSERDATLCVAEAIAARLDAAEGPAARRAYAEQLASWLSPEQGELTEAVDDLQSNPQVAALPREVGALSPAASLWFQFLEAELGATQPGDLSTLMLSLSRSTTDDLHPEWHNEPDLFDVLRHSLPGGREQEAAVFRQWAQFRTSLGDRSPGSRAKHWLWLQSYGRLSFDWALAYSSLPRKIASSRAVEPMGVSATWLDLDSVPLGARLGVIIEWEEPVRFAWRVLAVDAEGREMNRWDLPFLQSGHRLEKTLLNFEAAAGLVFLGVNLGGVDARHPFDPDAEPWEPHAFTLYLANLE